MGTKTTTTAPPNSLQDYALLIHQKTEDLFRRSDLEECIYEINESMQLYTTPPGQWHEMVQNMDRVKDMMWTLGNIQRYLAAMNQIHLDMKPIAQAAAMMKNSVKKAS